MPGSTSHVTYVKATSTSHVTYMNGICHVYEPHHAHECAMAEFWPCGAEVEEKSKLFWLKPSMGSQVILLYVAMADPCDMIHLVSPFF